MRYLSKAFSLIELILTLALISILASIAYPMYTHHLAKAYYYSAKTNLRQIASRLEQHRLKTGSYEHPPNNITDINDPHYAYQIQKATDLDYTVRATPQSNTAKKGNLGSLSFSSRMS